MPRKRPRAYRTREVGVIDIKLGELLSHQTIAGAMDLYHQAIDLASKPKHTRWLSPVLLVADALLCALIIWKIPCEL